MGQEKTNSTVRIDMLHGGIFRKLLLFALPLIASGILQQSFNSVDVVVVGQFAVRLWRPSVAMDWSSV